MLIKCCSCTWSSLSGACCVQSRAWPLTAIKPHPFSSGNGQWARSICCLRSLTLPPRNDNIASEADSLAVIERNGLQQIWQIESHQQPKLGLCRQPRGSEPPPRMVEKGRRGQIVTQMRKLVPGAVSLPHLTLRMWGRASCPLNAKVSSERGWEGL